MQSKLRKGGAVEESQIRIGESFVFMANCCWDGTFDVHSNIKTQNIMRDEHSFSSRGHNFSYQ